jgi:hypothetical protein
MKEYKDKIYTHSNVQQKQWKDPNWDPEIPSMCVTSVRADDWFDLSCRDFEMKSDHKTRSFWTWIQSVSQVFSLARIQQRDSSNFLSLLSKAAKRPAVSSTCSLTLVLNLVPGIKKGVKPSPTFGALLGPTKGVVGKEVFTFGKNPSFKTGSITSWQGDWGQGKLENLSRLGQLWVIWTHNRSLPGNKAFPALFPC